MTRRDDLRTRLGRMSDDLAASGEPLDELARLDELSSREPADITIGIATFDDFDGAFFTIAALRLYHPEVMQRAEILLIDNHPDGREAAALRKLAASVPRLHYVPIGSVTSTAVRDLIFRLATGDIVIALDSHVLVRPGGLSAVTDHLADPQCRDIAQGPLLTYDGETLIGTHWDPVWRAGMYGAWASDERAADPSGPAFAIPQQGLGVFACRRDAWPGLNPHFSGFGGEEGYLHEKFRLSGGRAMCLPALRWVHRFERPRGVAYDLVWEHRVRNYVVGWTELDLDVGQVRAHFTEFLDARIGTYVDELRTHMTHPLWRYDGIVVLNEDWRPGRWRRTRDALQTVSLLPRRLPPALDEESTPSVTASIAAAVRYAHHWGWTSFAVLGDGVITGPDDLDAAADRLRDGDDRSAHVIEDVAVAFDDGRSPAAATASRAKGVLA